jgi:hypothetical protein
MRSSWSGEDDQLSGQMEATVVVRSIPGVVRLMWHTGGTAREDTGGPHVAMGTSSPDGGVPNLDERPSAGP